MKMATQNFLKTLKTAKQSTTQLSYSLSKVLPNNNNNNNNKENKENPSTQNDVFSILDSLTSHKLQSLISDPNVPTPDCLRIFNAVLRFQPEISVKPVLHSHLTLVCRLIKSKRFDDAEILLQNAAFNRNHRYPFSDFASWAENYCNESRIITKLLNMLLKTYSDRKMFDMAAQTFDYMVEKGFERDERTCSIHLYTIIKSDKADLALEFFRRMVGSGMEVSVYSVTIMVDGLCNVGELKMGRDLVKEMAGKGVKPNVITLNTLVDACARRCNLVELDSVLLLMERERVQFNDTTYKLLVGGYSSCGMIEEAEKLVLEMHDKGIETEIYLFYTVIRGYCRLGNVNGGLSLFRKLLEREIAPNVDIYWCLISSLCKIGDMGPVKDLVMEMQEKGGEMDDVMCKTLTDAYSECGMKDELAELQYMLKMKHSSVGSSSNKFMDSESEIELVTDSDSEIELVMEEEAKPTTLDELI